MPFASEFDDVYEHLIKAVVAAEGYLVSRADDAHSSRNIMHDVIQGIADADLVVVDLTGSNANVYYELGLAHAFRKNVVLLTQDIDEVPFDLRAYRVVTYSTHFARIEEAKLQLRALAVGARDSTIQFGSPVSDFGTKIIAPPVRVGSPASIVQTQLESTDEAGSLDLAADLSEGMTGATQVLSEFNERINALQPEITKVSELMNGPMRHDPPRLRSVVRDFAGSIDRFATWLKGANSEYRDALETMTGALDQLFSPTITKLPDSRAQIPAVLAVFNGVEQSAADSRVHVVSLAEVLDALPKVEREFNRAKRRFAEELRSLVSNIDQTIAVMARTKSAGEQFLCSASQA